MSKLLFGAGGHTRSHAGGWGALGAFVYVDLLVYWASFSHRGQPGTDTLSLRGCSMARQINHIAGEIEVDWVKVNYAARPYLDAMFRLQSIDDAYGYDTGRSVVAYFLSNASSYRGETARKLKAELKAML